MERNPESLGSSSKSLTTLFWNLGNWRRRENWRLPVLSTMTRSTTRRTNQPSFQIMFQRIAICFCRCWKIWEHTLCWCVKQAAKNHIKNTYRIMAGVLFQWCKGPMCFGQIRKGRQYCSDWRSKGRWCLVRTKQKDQFWYFWNLLGTGSFQIRQNWLTWKEQGWRWQGCAFTTLITMQLEDHTPLLERFLHTCFLTVFVTRLPLLVETPTG